MNKLLTLFTAMSLLASPAWVSAREAAFASSADRSAPRSSVFAGATWRIGLDGRTGKTRNQASLRFSGMTHTPGTADLRLGNGLAIAAGQTGRPALFVGGQDIGQIERQANLNGGNTALIVGGVLLVLAVGAAVAWHELRDPCDYKECE